MRKSKRGLRAAALLLCVLAMLTSAVCAAAEPERYAVGSWMELEEVLADAVDRRAEYLIFSDAGGFEQLTDFGGRLQLLTLLHTLAAQSPADDFSAMNYNVLNFSMLQAGDLDGELYCYFEYLTTVEQEEQLDEACRKILQELSLEGLSDYEKLCVIYEYVCSNFVYDHDLKIYSAYEGLQAGEMTCQGYALLLYKLLNFAGIGCRIVTGVGREEAHGWNIVKLNGKWYNLDATWDACQEIGAPMTWNWFLLNEEDFTDHERRSSYMSSQFLREYPMAKRSYASPRVQVLLGGDDFSSLIIRKGNTAEIEVTAQGNYTIESADPSVVRVNDDGTLTAVSVGTCMIRVSSDKLGELPAVWKTTVVDLSSASAWAKDAVTAYYLDNKLPTSLCAQMQSPLTRTELARLLFPLASAYYPDRVKADLENPFTDTEESADGMYIYYLWRIGILDGVGNDLFAPDKTLTREQAAKILVLTAEKLLGSSWGATDMPSCADAGQVSLWAQKYVAAAMELGLLKGYADGTFRPQGVLTREQMICALERLRVQCAEANK